jgi:hypothetical protein
VAEWGNFRSFGCTPTNFLSRAVPLSNVMWLYMKESRMAAVAGAARDELEGKACGIPYLAKNERDAPNFLYAALDRTACSPLRLS